MGKLVDKHGIPTPDKAAPANVAKTFAKYQAKNSVPSLFELLTTKVREEIT
jgi:hypothetical protein